LNRQSAFNNSRAGPCREQPIITTSGVKNLHEGIPMGEQAATTHAQKLIYTLDVFEKLIAVARIMLSIAVEIISRT
jgi:hypothetical protein